MSWQKSKRGWSTQWRSYKNWWLLALMLFRGLVHVLYGVWESFYVALVYTSTKSNIQ